METKYTILFDKNGKKRATVCKIPLDYDNAMAIGLAFCSDDDKWNEIEGQRRAYARAMRALKGRRPCVARTYRIAKYVLNLRYTSLSHLMKLTEHQTKYFPKGFILN